MRNAGLEETQAGIKIAGRNMSNLRYADDITLMAGSEEDLKSLLMRVKEESEKWLELNIKNIYFCFIDYAKVFDCVNHNKLISWKIRKEMGIPNHLYLPPEKSVCRSRSNS